MVVGESLLQGTEADMSCHIGRLAAVMTVTRIPLYIEELVIHITVCLSRARPVLCCSTLHYSGLCCTAQIPWLQDKLRQSMKAAPTRYQQLHHLYNLAFI